ncbi:glycosyltransferase [Streptomyces sp. AP-93]|uniref:glycosyltransferase n=1 Tax=Streptomyces sp. AP-93 TaxID=2929048 RepID=UPI001FAEED30|nr:glycosyltransferase [Streptomyces sp. AP-93]MCJ0875467.1 glycosyltransferase [Streptomyces sp. AP-93]
MGYLLVAACASLAVWLWLTLGQGMFWRTDTRLPPRHAPARWPSVAIVVPARDEAEVLPLSLPSLLAQDYPGEAEVILVDDGSTDGTADLARRLADAHPGLPLTVLSPGEPGAGWTGKLWALRHGIAHARSGVSHARSGARSDTSSGAGSVLGSSPDPGPDPDPGCGPDSAQGCTPDPGPGCTPDPGPGCTPDPAPGCTPDPGPDSIPGSSPGSSPGPAPDYLLLTDADIAHEPDSLRELVSAATAADLDLVSQMARLRAVSVWERLIVPAFVYFFAQLYPFRWINRPAARTAAAAGGCVLLRTEAAVRAGVPESIRQAVIDDVSLARAVQRTGGRIWLGLAERVDSVRPYTSLADLWRMVSRSAYAQLRHHPALLAGTVAGLVLVYLVPPAALLAGLAAGRPAVAWAGGLAWMLMAGTYLPMLRYYRQPAVLAPLLPLTALLYLLMTVDSAVQHYRGRGAAWKGRTYARPEDA